MNFSIVIPIYNEADNIKSLVDEIYYVFKNNDKNEYEVILINDASNDNTSQIIICLEKKYTNLKIINNKINIGQRFCYKKNFIKNS